jgi:hypothetical protein
MPEFNRRAIARVQPLELPGPFPVAGALLYVPRILIYLLPCQPPPRTQASLDEKHKGTSKR